MNVTTVPVIGSFRNTLGTQSLRIFEKEEWGAHNPEHRQKMREFLRIQAQPPQPATPQSSQDPLVFPEPLTRVGEKYCSLTHTLKRGLIALDSFPVGIDLEENSRVQARVVARIASSAKELERMPNPAALWTAKEAAFKALYSFTQPPVMSQLEIGGWRESQDGLIFFELKNAEDFSAPQGRGALFQSDIWSLAVFSFSS